MPQTQKTKKPKKVKKPKRLDKSQEVVVTDDDVAPMQEHFELLISDEYELTRPIPVHVYRYQDGTVVIRSLELNLYAQGFSDHDARREFSEILTDELEDLEFDIKEGQPLGRALQLELSMLRRLLRRVEQ